MHRTRRKRYLYKQCTNAVFLSSKVLRKQSWTVNHEPRLTMFLGLSLVTAWKKANLDKSLTFCEWLLHCNLLSRVSHFSALLEQEGRVSRSGGVGRRRDTLGMRLALLLGHVIRIPSCHHQFLLHHGMLKATHPIPPTCMQQVSEKLFKLYELSCINKTYNLRVTVPIWHKNVVGYSRTKQ